MDHTVIPYLQTELQKAMKSEIRMKKDGVKDGLLYDTVIAVKHVVRGVLSMLPDMDIKPENASDELAHQLLKKYIFKEKTSLLYTSEILTQDDVVGLTPKELTALTKKKIYELGKELSNLEIDVANTYLPPEAGPEDIKKWIELNIDFSQFKNKMQAMKPVMDEFKTADGTMVKEVIMGMN